MVLRGKCKSSVVELVAIGYRFNSKRVLHFVTTVGEGRTSKGAAYQMKFNDAHANVCHRDIAHPAVILRYFKVSNPIDVNNQMQQRCLALEECWVTGNRWFCLWITFMGWTVTDTWFLCRELKAKL